MDASNPTSPRIVTIRKGVRAVRSDDQTGTGKGHAKGRVRCVVIGEVLALAVVGRELQDGRWAGREIDGVKAGFGVCCCLNAKGIGIENLKHC